MVSVTVYRTRLFFSTLAVTAIAGVGSLTFATTHRDRHGAYLPRDLVTNLAGGHTIGRLSAPVEVIEFGDYECPACMLFAEDVLPRLIDTRVKTGDVRFRFIDFPLEQHRNEPRAIAAAACAADQSRFWEMHHQLFKRQTEWDTEATSEPGRVFVNIALRLGLDTAVWRHCFESVAVGRISAAGQATGRRAGVSATPTLVIGSRVISGNVSLEELEGYIQQQLKRASR